MNPATMLQQARTDGLKIALTPEGEITARGLQSVVAKWVPILRPHKPAIVALLQAASEPVAAWDAADWTAYFDERAGVAEFDGCLPRREAEQQAWRGCIAEWLCQNHTATEPGECAWCGRGDLAGRALLPFGDEVHGEAWFHSECWPQWWARRHEDAIEALAAMGIHEGSAKP